MYSVPSLFCYNHMYCYMLVEFNRMYCLMQVEFNKAAQSLTDALVPSAQKKNALNRLVKVFVNFIGILLSSMFL